MTIFHFRFKSQKGIVGLYLAIIVLVLSLGIVMSIVLGVVGQQRALHNITKSAQAYYAAEAGQEDALLRLSKQLDWISPYSFAVGDATANVTISGIIGGVRTLETSGDANNRIRAMRVIYQIDSQEVSFNFGAQIAVTRI